MLISEKIETTFVELLQHNIDIVFNKKILKTGRLLLISHKTTMITLTMQLSDGSIKAYDLPYPFDFRYHGNESDKYVMFDYSLTAVGTANYNLNDLTDTSKHKPHRFINNNIIIKCID